MRNVLILGSGRSGTSMVAGLFAGSGCYMGETISPPQPANPKGYFEALEVNALNESILGGVPHRPVPRRWWVPASRPRAHTVLRHFWLARVPLHAAVHAPPQAAAAIAELTSHTPYCFKDPRFCYSLPAWRPYLRDCCFICVFRAPNTTAESMVRDVSSSPFYWQLRVRYRLALDVWACMYEHVLRRHRREGDWLFLHYDQVLTGDGLDRIAGFTGAALDRSFPDRSLQRVVSSRRLPRRARELYGELCAAAGYAFADMGEGRGGT